MQNSWLILQGFFFISQDEEAFPLKVCTGIRAGGNQTLGANQT
jgi:hypothetical protein